MDLPEEIRTQIPRWKQMGYEPHLLLLEDGKGGQALFVFRTLTHKEFLVLVAEAQVPSEFESLGRLYAGGFKDLIRTALLWPAELDPHLPAATDRFLAEAIVETSGWSSEDRLSQNLSEARDEATTLLGFLYCRVSAAFPSIHPDTLRDIPLTKLMRLVAMSEVITQIPVDLDPWLHPEEYKKRMDREDKKRRKGGQDPRVEDPERMRKMMSVAEEAKQRLEGRRRGLPERPAPTSGIDFVSENASILSA